MNLFIDETSSRPIYEQIEQAVKNCILNGELSTGTLLPSIRSLARDLGISVITTKRAYEELEKQGLIYSVQGRGFFVAAANRSLLLEEQLKELETEAASLVAKARQLRVSKEELTTLLDTLWEKEEES